MSALTVGLPFHHPMQKGRRRRGKPEAGGTHTHRTCGTKVTGQEGLKWSEMPRCTAGVTLTATDTIASP